RFCNFHIIFNAASAHTDCTNDLSANFKREAAAKDDDASLVCRVQSVQFRIRHCSLFKIGGRHLQCHRRPGCILRDITACAPSCNFPSLSTAAPAHTAPTTALSATFKREPAAKADDASLVCRVQSVQFRIRHCSLFKIGGRHLQCHRRPGFILRYINACQPCI